MATATDGSIPPARTGGNRWLNLLLDVGPVLLLILLALVDDERPRPGRIEADILLVVLPLVVRRRWPMAVLLLVSTGSLVTAAESNAPWVQAGAVALASFTVGERLADRTRSALIVIAVSAVVALGLLALGADGFEAIVLPFVILVPTWLLGDVIRTRRVDALRRAEAIERAMREREEVLRAAAAEERRHVARELHDVVAHAVSVMVIQAGAARKVFRSSPEQAEESLLAVESTGREAMTELRRFLGALSDDGDDEAAGLAPQPGIAELSALLDRVREAGLPALLEIDGEARAVPASLDVTVYRIVQEALTNALRYAQRAATLVHLSWEAEQLRVEILDDGPTAADVEGSGRGLVGMRERATLVGGHLEAGPRLGGGYAVRAWLPLGKTAALESEAT
jgi:signal transduction histidine kinase